MLKNEKEKLLAVATPEQWDWWLTLKADDLAPRKNNRNINWATFLLLEMESPSCFFCKAFNKNCSECMPGGRYLNCLQTIPGRERVDMAIERLERAGIWD